MAVKQQAKQLAKKEAVYTWVGKDKAGNKVKGETVAGTPAKVKAELRLKGISPTKVVKKPKPLFGEKKAKITAKDISVFSRQLATMMSSGVPLIQGFDIVMAGHDNPSMRDLLQKVRADVSGGNGLGDSLAKHPKYFDELFCNLVRSGEKSGTLETMLDRIATYKEKSEAMKSKLKKAMFYPIAVIVVAFVVTAILLLFVVPQFEELFSSMGAELPALTQFVVGLSRGLASNWYIIFGGIGLAIWGFFRALKTSEPFAFKMDSLALRLPVFGDILDKGSVARFARTLGIMFAAGVPLIDAMTQVAGAVGNRLYASKILAMREEVSTGQRLAVSMENARQFPPMVVQMVSIGEESGALDGMLNKVADFFEQEVDDAIDGLSSLIEPIIMAVLGVILGTLILAMYLPIFQLGDVA